MRIIYWRLGTGPRTVLPRLYLLLSLNIFHSIHSSRLMNSFSRNISLWISVTQIFNIPTHFRYRLFAYIHFAHLSVDVRFEHFVSWTIFIFINPHICELIWTPLVTGWVFMRLTFKVLIKNNKKNISYNMSFATIATITFQILIFFVSFRNGPFFSITSNSCVAIHFLNPLRLLNRCFFATTFRWYVRWRSNFQSILS